MICIIRYYFAESGQTLTFKLIPKIDDALKADVIKWSAFYEHRIRLGSVSYSENAGLISPLTLAETHIPPGGVCRKVHENIRRVRASFPMPPSYANGATGIS